MTEAWKAAWDKVDPREYTTSDTVEGLAKHMHILGWNAAVEYIRKIPRWDGICDEPSCEWFNRGYYGYHAHERFY